MNPIALAGRSRLGADQFLAALVSSSADAIIGQTPDGVVLSWNPAAERLYGYAAGEMLGRDIVDVVPPERLSELHKLLALARQGHTVHDCTRNDCVRIESASRCH